MIVKKIKNMTYTKGRIVIENIKIGDIHYEFEYNCGIKCAVIASPIRSDDGQWRWKSKNVKTGQEIDYLVTDGFEHYGPNLYDYMAYNVGKWV
jgi:hypothetical protein